MACLYSVMLPWQRNTRQLKYQNTEVYLFILCYANFGDPGINGFGKIENATQVSKTVFSHLNKRTRVISTSTDINGGRLAHHILFVCRAAYPFFCIFGNST